MTSPTFRAALVLLALLQPRLGAAQSEIPLIRLNQPVQSELTVSDPVLEGEGAFKAFRFTAEAGRSYDFALRSDQFAPALTIARNVGGITRYLQSSEDHGLRTGAYLRFEAPESDSYLILAKAPESEFGSFTLDVALTVPDEGAPLVLNASQNAWVDTEAFHHFEATAGDDLVITLRSRDFDTYLEIGRMVDGAFVADASDDDGGGSTDSRLYFAPPVTGLFTARVAPFSRGAGGSYAIALTEAVDLPVPASLSLDRAVVGQLAERGPGPLDEPAFADWSFPANAGDRFRIEVRSTDFDTYLAIGTVDGREFTELFSNDDSGDANLEATDSRLIFTASADGDYIARVSSFNGEGSGSYTLLAVSLPPALADPTGGSIEIGETVTGTIADTDALMHEEIPYQQWTFSAAAGEELVVDLASEAFDTHLFVGSMVEGDFQELTSNDDWEGSSNGTDSRAAFSVPRDGEYVIRVTPFSKGQAGEYTLALGRP